jgi:hypothetical protein
MEKTAPKTEACVISFSDAEALPSPSSWKVTVRLEEVGVWSVAASAA